MITTRTSLLSLNKKNVIRLICLFTFYLIGFKSISQEVEQKKPLSEVLILLENRFDYQFTYADNLVRNLKTKIPDEALSFEEVLTFLEKETNLSFELINNNFIVIREKKFLKAICGYIKEYGSEFSLSYATVQGSENSVVTNDQGYFQLEVTNPDEELVIKYLGYKEQRIKVNELTEEECLTIYIRQVTQSLNEIVIKNYITKGISRTSDGGIQVDYSDFGILPGLIESDVLQTIQALPGIQSIDETVSNINIRGGTHDQNLILWDGIRMYQSGHFFGLISVFNPNNTKRATIIKNGTSTQYTDGVSGTIMMNTKSEINDSLSISVGTNLINSDVFADIPIGKKSSLQITARKAISELFETPTYSEYFDRIKQNTEIENNQENAVSSDLRFDFYDTNLRWNYHISSNDKIRLNFLLLSNDLVFQENAVVSGNFTSRQSSVNQSSIAGGIFYDRKWNEKFSSVLQVYNTDYMLRAENANLVENQRFLQENRVSETGVKLSGLYKLKSNLQLLSGYQLIETGIGNLNDIDNPRFVDEKIRVTRTHSLFTEAILKSADNKTNLNLGVRYTYNDKLGRHFIEPRISINRRFKKYFAVELLGEFKHQNTSQIINFQNDFLGVEKRRWVLSNDQDIPIIQGRQLSGGVTYNRNDLLVSLDMYYKNVDGITARSQGFQTKYEFENGIGKYDVMGIEVLVSKKLKNFNGWFSYSFGDNEYTFDDFEDVNFPNNINIIHSVTAGGSYTFNQFKLSAGVNWHSGLPTSSALPVEVQERRNIVYGEANSSNLEPYFRADLSAVYDFRISKGIKGNAGVSLWNVTNNRNVIGDYYALDSQNLPDQNLRTALGFTPNAVLRVSF